MVSHCADNCVMSDRMRDDVSVVEIKIKVGECSLQCLLTVTGELLDHRRAVSRVSPKKPK